jgi:superfamily II DNA or RNA helicase
MERSILILKDRIRNIKCIFDDIIDEKEEVVKDFHNISDKLFQFLKSKDTKWLDKFHNMLKSFIEMGFIFDNNNNNSDIKNIMLKNNHIDKHFVNYFFDGIKSPNIKKSRIVKIVYDDDDEEDDIKNNISIDMYLANIKTYLRVNQIQCLKKIAEQNFKSGIVNHVMGSGKTVCELITIDLHYATVLKSTVPASYLYLSSRKDILNKIFTGDNKFEKYKFDMKKYKIINYVNNDVSHKDNILSSKKPNIIICNIQYLSQVEKHKYYDTILSQLQLIIFDECHNISAPTVYNMLKHSTKNIGIIGFSATPVRTSKHAKTHSTDIFSLNNSLNLISTYDLFEGIADGIVLPFLIHKYEITDKKTKYNNILQILTAEIKKLPYIKIVCWCKTIASLYNWKQFFEKNMKNINIYVTHSGNAEFPEENEYDKFYNLVPDSAESKLNSILLCVGKITEGCDIDFVDAGIFIDPVQKKNIVQYLQCAGRICRPDKYNRKKYATIIYTYTEKKAIDSADSNNSAKQIIHYYELLLQLSDKKSGDYYTNILTLSEKTELNKNNEVVIKIDNNKDHDCIIKFDKKIEDWNNITKEIKKIINTKIKNSVNEDFSDITKINKYDFTFTKPSDVLINNKSHIFTSYKSIYEYLYVMINDINKIKEHTELNISDGEKNDYGFTYIKKLKISIQGVDSKKCVSEIIRQCYYNNIEFIMRINPSNKSKLKVQLILQLKNKIFDIRSSEGNYIRVKANK